MNRSWYGDALFAGFHNLGLENYLEQGRDWARHRRVVDFQVMAGSILAKVYLEDKGRSMFTAQDDMLKISVQVEPFSQSEWQSLFAKLSENSLYLASILSGELPLEMEEACLSTLSRSLVPSGKSEINISASLADNELLPIAVSAVLWKFWDSLENDPFLLFRLRGMSREEAILRLRRARLERRRKAYSENAPLPNENLPAETNHFREVSDTPGSAGVLESSADAGSSTGDSDVLRDYWDYPTGECQLHFNIRADELPAALLRRLDPLPLSGLEDEVEVILETAYETIANRAQAFGLGFMRSSKGH